ncbi:MAG: sterol desaturase family protein [Kordiimonadaceae bacterium]|jgi:sterol desaturase/sphingolipid hydroxylase (fatty acid hydroxylase superfamily)|nr:sterol desaturase family protein [Kordiimonadaceae bacterium]MBT6036858.1 sterol desaturase family protein [Kordiimonadaceae bacterium]
MDLLIENEQNIRLAVSVGLLIVLACAEFIAPLAVRRIGRPRQWLTNISIIIIDTAILRLLFPLLAVGVAAYADENSIGLFNMVPFDNGSAILLSLLLLDLLIYGQHVLVHKVPLLWRLHRMHHTELGLDVTSANRFHPIEIIISMLIKMLFVLIMGVPVAAVILFEILLNGLALFNHSNIKLPAPLEKILRTVIITPEIHWIHHSEIVKETNSNYGFNLCVWDKLFGTYIDKPTLSYDQMQQGLSEFGLEKPLGIFELIISPFKNYPANREQE